jgi:predicted ferric reductase
MGNLFVFLTITSTLYLFLLAKIYVPEGSQLFTLLSQISGLLGSVLISLNFLISTRLKFIEKIFNGLDKAYHTHNIVGNVAMIFVINHPLFLIIQNLPFNTINLYLAPSVKNLPYAFGILSLYTLILLVVVTLFVDLPYKFWKKTHELMGLVIIFGSIHGLMITSDISRFLPLKIWIVSLNTLAVIAFLYKRYFYYLFLPKSNYKIVQIIHEKNYLLLTLTAVGRGIVFEAGQFAFISLPDLHI